MVFNLEAAPYFQKANACSGCATRWRQCAGQLQQLAMNNSKVHFTIAFFLNVETDQLVCLFCLSITGMLERLMITVGPTLPVRLPSCCVTSPS